MMLSLHSRRAPRRIMHVGHTYKSYMNLVWQGKLEKYQVLA
jgi:hypothetical protein